MSSSVINSTAANTKDIPNSRFDIKNRVFQHDIDVHEGVMFLFLPFISVLSLSFGKGQNDSMLDDSLWTHCWVKSVTVSLKSQL